MKVYNLAKLSLLSLLFLTGQVSSFDSSETVRSRFENLARELGNHKAWKHGTRVEDIDFTDSDRIHHQRWCGTGEKCRINVKEVGIITDSEDNEEMEYIIWGEMAIWFEKRIDSHHLWFWNPSAIISDAKSSGSEYLVSLTEKYSYGSRNGKNGIIYTQQEPEEIRKMRRQLKEKEEEAKKREEEARIEMEKIKTEHEEKMKKLKAIKFRFCSRAVLTDSGIGFIFDNQPDYYILPYGVVFNLFAIF